ncbi:GTPase domain-containing protein [candidate division KSB1 bacterium]|nr:GTPase domain-containing protein [candidate division KSB1 bacterium]
MYIDRLNQEIIFKIVYYGPGLGGKTTNLEYIHSNLNPSLVGDLISLESREERTLYFDFLPIEFNRIKGKKPRFHLYTIPGQVHYSLTRKFVLNGCDGVVFVADSQTARMDDNLEMLMDLEKKLIAVKKSLSSMPWVLQYNKRDLTDVASIDRLQEKLNFLHVPYFNAIAISGEGVFQTLSSIIKLVLATIQG